MKNSEYSVAIQDVIYLARCVLNGSIPEKDQLQCGQPDTVLKAAGRHMMSAITAVALESCGIKTERTAQAVGTALRRTLLFRSELSEVERRLNDAEIWFVPLKGIILQNDYPEPGMREMVDHDILIDAAKANDIRDIMEGLGFVTKQFNRSKHDIYFKPPVYNFQMHTCLFRKSREDKFYEYFKDIDKRLVKEDGSRRQFTPEDFYIYMIAHEYKHYAGEGTGLRSLADTYIYLKNNSLDMDYIKAEMKKLDLNEYEAINRSLSLKLFGAGEEKMTDQENQMLDYILASGTHGNIQHKVENDLQKNKQGKLRYMADRFLVPVSRKNEKYAAFSKCFPFFYKHKILLIFLPFYRTLRAVKSGRFRKEASALKNAKRGQKRIEIR